MADGKGRGKISRADKSGADWVTNLGNSLQEEKPPEGFKNLSELCEDCGAARTTIRNRVKAMIRSGQLQEISVRVVSDGAARVTKYYGPK